MAFPPNCWFYAKIWNRYFLQDLSKLKIHAFTFISSLPTYDTLTISEHRWLELWKKWMFMFMCNHRIGKPSLTFSFYLDISHRKVTDLRSWLLIRFDSLMISYSENLTDELKFSLLLNVVPNDKLLFAFHVLTSYYKIFNKVLAVLALTLNDVKITAQ